MNILIAGANGQLGNEMQYIATTNLDDYIFTDATELDITDLDAIRNVVHLDNIRVIVNCAAYTNIDKAEDDYGMTNLLNNRAVESLAVAAKKVNAILTHISTDYVFQGDKNMSYGEDCETNPLGVCDKTKRAGEQNVQRAGCNHLIFRIAWLYSQLGKNFVKTMRQLTADKDKLRVVFNQIGTPTYAEDLADIIYRVIGGDQYHKQGIHHFSDEGVCSWYDFAKEICKLSGNSYDIQPCHSGELPSKVKRPHFSILDKTKLKLAFGIEIPYWRDFLVKCINEFKENN